MIAAIIGMATAQAAHDIQYAVSHNAPWHGSDNGKNWDWGDFLKGQTQAGTVGGTLGYAGAIGGGAVGGLFGGASGTAGAGATGASTGAISGVAEGAAGATIGGAGAATLGSAGADAIGAAGAGTIGSAAGGGVAASAESTLPSAISEVVGSNLGSVAQEAGAANPVSTLGAVVTPDKASLLTALQQNAPAALQQTATNVVLNSGVAALQDREHPLRAALTAAASSVAGGLVNYGAGSALKYAGQGRGIVNTEGMGHASLSPTSGEEFSYRPPVGVDRPTLSYGQQSPWVSEALGRPSLAPRVNPSYSPPSLGEQAIGLAGRAGSYAASKGAGHLVGSAMEPRPGIPPSQTNPWSSYNGSNPYWLNRRY